MKKLMKKVVALLCAIAMVVTSLNLWNQMQAVEASETEQTETSTVTPKELEGFRTITTKNFVDANGNIMGDKTFSSSSNLYSLVDDEGNPIDSFDHTLLTMKLNFGTGDTNAYSRIEFAGKDTSTGFRLFAQSNNYFQFNNVASKDTAGVVNKDAYTYFPVTSAATRDVIVQISTEYGNFDDDNTVDDIKINIYIDGTLALEKQMTDCNMNNLGNKFRVYIYSTTSAPKGPVSISSPIQEEETVANNFVTLPGFRSVGPTNLVSVKDGHNMGNSTTFSDKSGQFKLVDDEGNEIPNYDKTLLSMKVKFNQTGSSDNAYEIRFGGTTTTNGVKIYAGATSVVFMRNNFGDRTIEDGGLGQVLMTKLNEYGITGVTDKEINLQVSTEYMYSDTTSEMSGIKFVIYINGVKAHEQVISSDYINQDKLGNSFCVMATSAKTMKISSITEQKFVTVPGFTTITANNFVDSNGKIMGDKTFSTSSSLHSLIDDEGNPIDSFDHTLLTMKLNFGTGDTSAYSRIEFAGKDVSTGFKLFAQSNNYFQFNNVASKDTAGVVNKDAYTYFPVTSAATRDVIVQISTEYGNFDDDNTVDDIKINIYIDGTLALEKQMTDCNMNNLGNKFRVYIYSTDTNPRGPVTISTVPSMYGDTNPNGVTDIRDLVATVKASEGLALKHSTGSLGADVSKNGRIDLDDILSICKKLLQR